MSPPPLPLELIDHKVPVLAVRVGQSRPLAFVVDTGAEENILNSAVLDELGLADRDTRRQPRGIDSVTASRKAIRVILRGRSRDEQRSLPGSERPQ